MAHPQPANMDLDPAGSGQQTQAQQQSAQAAASGSAPPARRDLTSHPISNLVPLPQFASGQDPAQYLGLLMSWAEMGLMDLTVPGMLQNMLVQGCAADKKSLEFALHYKQERPSASLADTQAAFVDRFGKEVRSKAAKARDLLFNRQIRMVGNMTVQDYTTNFRLQIMYVPEMHENDRIRWFHAGLSPALRTECIVDSMGNEFTTLDGLIRFAIGAERRMQILQQSAPRFAPSPRNSAMYLQMASDDAPPAKAQRVSGHGPSFGEVAAQDPTSGRGGNAGRGNTIRGRGSNGSGRGSFNGGSFMTGQAGAGRGGIRGRGNAGAGGMRGRGGGRSFPRKLMEKDLTKMSSITSPIDGHLMSLFEVNAYLNGNICFNCGKQGHMGKECRAPKKQWADANSMAE